MNKKTKLILFVIALILLAVLLWFLTNSLFNVLGGVRSVGATGESDPMFAEEMETVTRPPEMDAEETQADHPTLDDYVPEIQSPVEKTAQELIEEAQAEAASNTQA